MPVACQSREEACPQAGESTFPHQEQMRESVSVLFWLEDENDALKCA